MMMMQTLACTIDDVYIHVYAFAMRCRGSEITIAAGVYDVENVSLHLV